jgi:hypothetical protein
VIGREGEKERGRHYQILDILRINSSGCLSVVVRGESVIKCPEVAEWYRWTKENKSHELSSMKCWRAVKSCVYTTLLPLGGITGSLCQDQLWLQVAFLDFLITTQLHSDR